MVEIQEPIRFIGIDPFLDGAVRNWTPSDRDEESLIKFLSAVPPAVYLTGNFMSRHNLRPGDTLTVLTAGFEKKIASAWNISPARLKSVKEIIWP